ncbi:MAG: ABC transporter substrate-binding protein [Lachnospirales bacterium]
MKKNLKIAKAIAISSVLLLTGCSSSANATTENEEPKEEVLEAENNLTDVYWYGWGGDEVTNKWFDEEVTNQVLENTGLNFHRVGMDIGDILLKLNDEKIADDEVGDIDIVWINGENFAYAKENGLLLENIAPEIENFNTYYDTSADLYLKDFNTEINGDEVPLGVAQFVMIANTNTVENLPTSSDDLLIYAMENPGKFTYPSLPDFSGSAFVRSIVYDIVEYDAVVETGGDKELLRATLMPVFDYFNELEPYMWQEGTSYPTSEASLHQMYQDGVVDFSMSYTTLIDQRNVLNGTFPKGSKSFVFDSGSPENAHYLAIPFNAPNKEGAIKAINEILSPELQLSKYQIDNWGDLPGVDMGKLDEEMQSKYDEVNGQVVNENLMEIRSKGVPEFDAQTIVMIEELWEEEVLNK